MDRVILAEHLTLAERHVADGERVLEHQRRIIEDLRRDGNSAGMIDAAESLLRSFEEIQSLHLADAAPLRRELQGLHARGAQGRPGSTVRALIRVLVLGGLVEPGGIEPPTSCMPCKRSPS